jgi:hypothetical protein
MVITVTIGGHYSCFYDFGKAKDQQLSELGLGARSMLSHFC